VVKRVQGERGGISQRRQAAAGSQQQQPARCIHHANATVRCDAMTEPATLLLLLLLLLPAACTRAGPRGKQKGAEASLTTQSQAFFPLIPHPFVSPPHTTTTLLLARRCRCRRPRPLLRLAGQRNSALQSTVGFQPRGQKKKQPGGGGGKCAAAAATRPPIRSIYYYCSYGRRGPSGRLGTSAPTEQIAGVAVSDGTHAPPAARRRHSVPYQYHHDHDESTTIHRIGGGKSPTTWNGSLR
jgi:hypothetical protein